ncbi:MAG: hypothetical protein IKY01_04990 [Prevotella sp.]|nr:hypothetical protein [Prevotella sp.]
MRQFFLFLTLLFLSLMTKAQVVWFDGKMPITYSIPKYVEPVVNMGFDVLGSLRGAAEG